MASVEVIPDSSRQVRLFRLVSCSGGHSSWGSLPEWWKIGVPALVEVLANKEVIISSLLCVFDSEFGDTICTYICSFRYPREICPDKIDMRARIMVSFI